MFGQPVNDRPAGISQSKQLGDFIVGFSGGVIAGASYVFICPTE